METELEAAAKLKELVQDKDTGPNRLSFERTLERVRTAPVMSDEEIAEFHHQERMARRSDAMRSLSEEAGKRVSSSRFSNFKATTKYQESVVGTLREWVDTFEERRLSGDGIVLYGPVGTGKDHLAYAAIGTVVSQTGYAAKWVNGRELVGTVRDRISEEASEASFVRSMATPTILVISDPLPPIGDLTQHQADMLYRICEARYAAGLITVATLNVASDEEADRRLGVATWDRLCHGAWKIACKWESYRKPSRDIRPTDAK